MKMTESLVIKLICSNNGAMDYGDLVDFGSGLLNVKGVIDTVTGNDNFSVVTLNGNKRVVAKTKVRLCKARECTDCRNLHLCKFFLYGDCRNGRSRRGCRFCHDMTSEHNASVLRENNLQHLDRTELCTLLLQNDNTLLPPVCFSYNKGNGEYGNCPDQGSCRRLHICDRYLDGACPSGTGCLRSHDFFEPHPQNTLQERGVPSEMIGSMLSVYQNIQALKKGDGRNANTRGPAREKTEICPYFVKGSCKQGDRCWKEHSQMPYKWEIRSGNGWSALPDNEEIEKDFCNPANVYSRGSTPVYFDTMTRGSVQVRRLSTMSSVVQPTFVLTTEWAWFWQDEYDNWIQYASVEGQHRLASITSEDLEKQYLEDSNAVIEFTAGAQSYKLSLQDMIQSNERYRTKRLVRRRPVFVSAVDAEKARTSKTRPGNNFKAVPAYWDKSMLTDTGYKKISLQESSDEYQKILNLFQKTMRGFAISSVERVQNRSLWEVFQWQKDLMRKNNSGKNVGDRLLFHGTDSAHVEAICKQNFDWRLCGTHGTAYGKGSYFARDAKYSHCYTGSSGMRTMFVCRVLVGCYTKGDPSYLRPPSKDGGDSVFYDSCVDDVRDPSIFVVFEKHQVYPEYIIKYDEDLWLPSAMSTVTVTMFGNQFAPAPTTRAQKPAQVPPPVSATSAYSRPAQAAAPVSATLIFPTPALAPTPLSATSTYSKPAQAPTPVSATPVLPKPAQAPTPVSATSAYLRPAQAPTPVSATPIFPKPAQAATPVSATSAYSRLTQAPTPVTATPILPKPAQAATPISATSAYSRPTQAPTPVSATPILPKPAQAATPVRAPSAYSRPAQAPTPVSATPILPKPAQAPAPAPRSTTLKTTSVQTPSVTSKPAQVSTSTNDSAYYRSVAHETFFKVPSGTSSMSHSSSLQNLFVEPASIYSSSAYASMRRSGRSSPAGSRSLSSQQRRNAKGKDCTIL